MLLSPLVVPVGRAGRARLASLWARAVIRAFGVRLLITDPPACGSAPAFRTVALPEAGTPGTLVVANHVSWLDVPLVAAALPGRMLAKREIRRWPLLGPLAARGGTLFVDRDRLRALPAVVRALAEALGGGGRVIVFPEGSTWCGRGRGRFRNAAFQAALDAGADVQPVRIGYRPTGAAAFVGDDSLGASVWRVVTARGLTAELTVLPALPAGTHAHRRSLARAAQHAVNLPVDPGTGAGSAPTGFGQLPGTPDADAAHRGGDEAEPAPHAANGGPRPAVLAGTGPRWPRNRPPEHRA
ncbi:lysophospholipid acyltransferase family protein [Streptomyces sp. NPDC059176]|uniref:lysophospholipid acyltransferase family protein n=1 Tax=unclassified Streptomyces TaxID=2593676 RepID=UPI0036C04C26